jgi:predicted nucleic acid-binding protein
MKLAVDSSVLVAIFKAEPTGSKWLDYLIQSSREYELVACPIVWAETTPVFASRHDLETSMEDLSVAYDEVNLTSSYAAGRAFQDYSKKGGPRTHLIPDFLIAAHALCQCEGLVAADRGYYRHYFRKLKIHSI